MSIVKKDPITTLNGNKFFRDAYTDPSQSSRRTEIVALLDNIKELAEKRFQAAAEAKSTMHTVNTRPNTQVTSEHIERLLLSILARAAATESKTLPIAV